ncbi:MAG: glycosyltransferase family 2 protein [Coleofasciculaceae cyanobacterium RL_1_1]|nr:glycosyltransferase family 2 protein [Coleofasciculaceae cyanobacterium RL_1_1]
MQFSVVITTYNRRPLLERAIRSALNQSLAAETIVVDDASSDDTQAYVTALQAQLAQAGDTRLVYHRNATNLGHSRSVNLGVGLARGEWVKFLDDDDYLAPNCVRSMSEAIVQHPNAVICSCQAAQVDAQEREIERTNSTGPGKAFYIPQEDIHYGMLLEVVPFGTPVQVAAKRSAFLDSGGWDSDFDGNCDDIDSWIRIAQFGDAVFLNQCLVFRTVWEGSYNQTFSITRRLETNILMKRKIYPLVHLKYRSYLPSLVDVDRYLRLHWGLVAIHAGHPWVGLRTILSACTSRPAWSLLARSLVFRQNPWLVNKTHLTATAAHPTTLTDERLDISDFSASFAAYDATNPLASKPSWSLTNSPLASNPSLESPPLKSPPARPIEPEPLTSDHPDLKFRDLRNRIRLRSLARALLSGNVRFVAHLLVSFCAEYGQRGLSKFYPATPPVTKIPIASSSQHHSNITVSILKRIRYGDNTVNQPLHVANLRRYLRLRWAIAAFKQGYWLVGMQVAFPAILSIRAWKHWLHLIQLKQLQTQEQAIRQMFLQVHRPLSSSLIRLSESTESDLSSSFERSTSKEVDASP